MTHAPEGFPQVRGDFDAAYLEAALARAGLDVEVGDVSVEALGGGRMGGVVCARRCAGGRFVVKEVPRASWKNGAFDDPECSEARLIQAGLCELLPPHGIRYPALDAAWHEERDAWVVLMRDVSEGVVPRGPYDEDKFLQLLRATAAMHARFWDSAMLDRLPLATLDGPTRAFADPVLVAAGRGTRSEPWLDEACAQMETLLALVPKLLDLLSPADADLYLSLCEDRERYQAPLGAMPHTLCHGDLRRANVSFLDGRVEVFDWELAARAHASTDLQWLWFVTFWAYPPDDGKTIADRLVLRDAYVEALEEELAMSIDRDAFVRGWDLAFLRALAQLGFCLADADPDVAKARATAAFAEARRISDTL